MPRGYIKRTREPATKNPFIQRTIETINLKNRTVASAGRTQFLDPETGELIGDSAYVGIKQRVDADQFIKTYQAGLKAMFGMPLGASKLLGIILESYRDDPMNYGDRLYFSYNVAVKEYKYDRTQPTFINAMNYLIENDFIAAAVEPNLFYVNPSFFFKGNRCTLIKQYICDEKSQRAIEREKREGEMLMINEAMAQG